MLRASRPWIVAAFIAGIVSAAPHPSFGVDCNGNGQDDVTEIESGQTPDCNQNNVPDECDLAVGLRDDCNENGIPDECEAPEPLRMADTEFHTLSGKSWGIISADFDGDGSLDLAVVHEIPQLPDAMRMSNELTNQRGDSRCGGCRR